MSGSKKGKWGEGKKAKEKRETKSDFLSPLSVQKDRERKKKITKQNRLDILHLNVTYGVCPS